MTTPAQDPEERFDLYTREGAPLGRSKARALVHRDGDWHRSLHIWVWGILGGTPHVVFQRRSLAKDTSPGLLDVAVTGHARSGETLEETLREAEEEIGLRVTLSDLARLGLRRRSVVREGLQDNELQDIFARVAPADLGALTPNEAEVSELVFLPMAAAAHALGGGAAVHDFVPAPDGYYARALASLEELCRGRSPAAWEIG